MSVPNPGRALVGLLLSLLVVVATVAADADESAHYRVQAPTGWGLLPGQAGQISADLKAQKQLDSSAFHVRVQVWRSPRAQGSSGGRATLIVTSIATVDTSAESGRAIRRQLDSLRAEPSRASLSPDETELLSWRESLGDGVVEADLAWRHIGNQTESLSRALIARARDGTLHLIRGECIRSSDSGEELLAQCRRSLDSLALVGLVIEPLADLPEAGAEKTAAVADNGATPTETPEPDRAAPEPSAPGDIRSPRFTLRDPGDLYAEKPPVVVVPATKKEDNRHKLLFILGGLFLLVAFYLTTRSRNAALEQSDDSAEEKS